MTLHLRVVARSEVGLIRKNNQDSGYASPHLLVVADGMGGAAAGDLASAVAIDEIKRLDTPDLRTGAAPSTATSDGADDSDSTDVENGGESTVVLPLSAEEAGMLAEPGAAGLNPLLGRFAAAIAEANSRIADLVAADYTLEGMGTTVTGALFDGQRLALAHIGDSRAYLLRDGRLEQITHDHSWVQSLVDDGKITAQEAAYHPHRSLLLKVLNGQSTNDPDLTTVELRAGDRVLFCSDGLCGMVDDGEIASLSANPDLETAVSDLIDAALAAGGIDNITVLLAEALQGADLPPPAETTPPAGSTTTSDPDDTAVRRRPFGGTSRRSGTATAAAAGAAGLLGAAAIRDIPTVPRRAPGLPASDDDPDAEDLDEEDLDDDRRTGAADGGSASAARSARTVTADDESRYAPGPPAKRRVVKTLLVCLAVLLVTGAGLGAGYAWTRTQYFVGAADGQVAIYQGLPDGIPGLSLSQVYEVQELPVSTLPPYYQAQVATGIEVSSLAGARATVQQLQDAADRCAQPTPAPKPPPTETPGASESALPGPTVPITPAPSPTSAPAPAPTPGQTASPLPGQC